MNYVYILFALSLSGTTATMDREQPNHPLSTVVSHGMLCERCPEHRKLAEFFVYSKGINKMTVRRGRGDLTPVLICESCSLTADKLHPLGGVVGTMYNNLQSSKCLNTADICNICYLQQISELFTCCASQKTALLACKRCSDTVIKCPLCRRSKESKCVDAVLIHKIKDYLTTVDQMQIHNNYLHLCVHAALQRNVEVVNAFLNNNRLLISTKTLCGGTLLHYAGDSAVAALLLDRGALINATDNAGRTALFNALGRKKVKLVKFLLSKGAYSNWVDYQLCSPLHYIMHATDTSKRAIDLCKLLFQYKADPNRTNHRNETPLHRAIYCKRGDDTKRVQTLLEHGALVHIYDENEYTPLDIALRLGKKVCVGLLSKAAEKEGPPPVADSPFVSLKLGTYHPDMKQLFNKFTNFESLAYLFKYAHDCKRKDLMYNLFKYICTLTDPVRCIHSLFLNPSITCDTGLNQRFIKYAVQNSKIAQTLNVPLVELLIERGFDINTYNKHHGSLLQACVIQNNIEVVKKLLAHGARTNVICPKSGKYPFDLASSIEMINLLRRYSTDMGTQGGIGAPQAMIAKQNGPSQQNQPVVRYTTAPITLEVTGKQEPPVVLLSNVANKTIIDIKTGAIELGVYNH